MNCPNDNEKLKRVIFHNVEADYCPKCLGMWFDKDELGLAKDDADQKINWLDIDLWRDRGRFDVMRVSKFCPVCRVGLVQIKYDDSKVKLDFCKKCQGVWLDRGEFKQIINYLKNKSDYEILHHYARNFMMESWEVFSTPGKFREELEDVMMLLKLLKYKFVVQHPLLNSLIDNL